MKLSVGALLLITFVLCSCSTTPLPPINPEGAQAIRVIHEQEQLAYPLSFKEGTTMNGWDYASTIEAYTSALRRINLSQAPLEFQAVFQNYIQAWKRVQAIAATEPRELFMTYRQTPVSFLEDPNWRPNRKSPDEVAMFLSDFHHAKGNVERLTKQLKAWRAHQ